MNYIIATLLLLGTAISHAGIYEQDNNQGSVMYSDTPSANSKPVDTSGAANTISAPPSQAEPGKDKAGNKHTPNGTYKTFLIVSPKDQETTQGESDIPIKFNLVPALHEKNSIQILIDGQPFGQPSTSLNPMLNGVERGVHQLSAVILDANNQVIQQSNTLTLNVHRTSTQLSPAMQRPATKL